MSCCRSRRAASSWRSRPRRRSSRSRFRAAARDATRQLDHPAGDVQHPGRRADRDGGASAGGPRPVDCAEDHFAHFFGARRRSGGRLNRPVSNRLTRERVSGATVPRHAGAAGVFPLSPLPAVPGSARVGRSPPSSTRFTPRLKARWGRRWAAASISTAAVTVVIIVPFIFLVMALRGRSRRRAVSSIESVASNAGVPPGSERVVVNPGPCAESRGSGRSSAAGRDANRRADGRAGRRAGELHRPFGRRSDR